MTQRSSEQLRNDALQIWQAAVTAVDSTRLVRQTLRVESNVLIIGDDKVALDRIERIIVVGAGKAGAGMAAGVEEALGPEIAKAKQLTGWVNVPADCVRQLSRIVLHAARAPGRNEPTAEGVAGSLEILKLVETAGPNDLVLCLISGGGSALPAPIEGITLEDKQAVTKFLSAAGANIVELNTVRKALSRIKGGKLATACKAGRLATLVISDVLGDPLDVIASGPTVPSTTTALDALNVLERFEARKAGIAPQVFDVLVQRSCSGNRAANESACTSTIQVIGNNATAVDAAGLEAERLGYSHAMHAMTQLEGAAEAVGKHLAEMAIRMRVQNGPDCLITGGEPTVTFAPEDRRGRGGRNQQLVLAALQQLDRSGVATGAALLLSGGTDGEDGPTDAAGAIIDERMMKAARFERAEIEDALTRNDAYHFLASRNGLIKTGPTHTNVCDVRVVVVSRAD